MPARVTVGGARAFPIKKPGWTLVGLSADQIWHVNALKFNPQSPPSILNPHQHGIVRSLAPLPLGAA